MDPEEAEEINKSQHLVEEGKNKIFKKGMTEGAMREALKGFIKQRKVQSVGQNIAYIRIIERVERIVHSDV